MCFRLTVVFLSLLLIQSERTSASDPELALARIFQDRMVLQRSRPVKIWGRAGAESKVSVRFGDQKKETIAGKNGSWMVSLAPMKASNIGQILRVESDGKTIERKTVVVGDVWHASGQSNMAMTVGSVIGRLPAIKEEIQKTSLPLVRFCRISSGSSRIRLDELGNSPNWQACTPETVARFSAAAFFFARRIHGELKVPIGVIDSSRGGTPIEPFIPQSAFHSHPTLRKELELGAKDDLLGIWKLPGGVRARDGNWLPGRLFHSRLAPIRNFAVKGLIWYQGESNCGDGEDPRDYRYKMRALIKGWRKELGDDQLPCYFVQLPGSGARVGWPYLREEQRLSLGLPHTGMAVTIDLLDRDIHPANKLDVGKRLARLALADIYGKKIVPNGPLFRSAELRDRKSGEQEFLVSFSNVGSGLMVAKKPGLEPPKEQADLQLRHFEVGDSEGNWYPAIAAIERNSVVVRCGKVKHPVAVRYAYAIDPPNCHLFNREGLPASPFCSKPDLLRYEPVLPKN